MRRTRPGAPAGARTRGLPRTYATGSQNWSRDSAAFYRMNVINTRLIFKTGPESTAFYRMKVIDVYQVGF